LKWEIPNECPQRGDLVEDDIVETREGRKIEKKGGDNEKM